MVVVYLASKWIKKKPVRDYLPFETITEKLASIYGIDDLEEFLRPTEKSLYNPLLLDNIKEACARIVKAIKNNEKICISYDSDCK